MLISLVYHANKTNNRRELRSTSRFSMLLLLNALQKSFNNLLAADDKFCSYVTLSGFLQSFAQNLQSASATGNMVSTKV